MYILLRKCLLLGEFMLALFLRNCVPFEDVAASCDGDHGAGTSTAEEADEEIIERTIATSIMVIVLSQKVFVKIIVEVAMSLWGYPQSTLLG